MVDWLIGRLANWIFSDFNEHFDTSRSNCKFNLFVLLFKSVFRCFFIQALGGIYVGKQEGMPMHDKVLFVQGYGFHGKNFERIRDLVPNHSLQSLVNHYYTEFKRGKQIRVSGARPETDVRKLTNAAALALVADAPNGHRGGHMGSFNAGHQDLITARLRILEGGDADFREASKNNGGESTDRSIDWLIELLVWLFIQSMDWLIDWSVSCNLFCMKKRRHFPCLEICTQCNSIGHYPRSICWFFQGVAENGIAGLDGVTIANDDPTDASEKHERQRLEICQTELPKVAEKLTPLRDSPPPEMNGALEEIVAEAREATQKDPTPVWQQEEIVIFMRSLVEFGTDFAKSSLLLPSKTEQQVRNMYYNREYFYGLDKLVQVHADRLANKSGWLFPTTFFASLFLFFRFLILFIQWAKIVHKSEFFSAKNPWKSAHAHYTWATLRCVSGLDWLIDWANTDCSVLGVDWLINWENTYPCVLGVDWLIDWANTDRCVLGVDWLIDWANTDCCFFAEKSRVFFLCLRNRVINTCRCFFPVYYSEKKRMDNRLQGKTKVKKGHRDLPVYHGLSHLYEERRKKYRIQTKKVTMKREFAFLTFLDEEMYNSRVEMKVEKFKNRWRYCPSSAPGPPFCRCGNRISASSVPRRRPAESALDRWWKKCQEERFSPWAWPRREWEEEWGTTPRRRIFRPKSQKTRRVAPTAQSLKMDEANWTTRQGETSEPADCWRFPAAALHQKKYQNEMSTEMFLAIDWLIDRLIDWFTALIIIPKKTIMYLFLKILWVYQILVIRVFSQFISTPEARVGTGWSEKASPENPSITRLSRQIVSSCSHFIGSSLSLSRITSPARLGAMDISSPTIEESFGCWVSG